MSTLADNYCALALCILSDTPSDQSIRYFDLDANKQRVTGKQEQTKEMLELRKQGKTMEQIGAAYGLTRSAVCIRLKKFLGRVEHGM